MKHYIIGGILIVLALSCIVAGIVLKRTMAMGDYLPIFHGTGGILLLVGIGTLFLGGKGESD